MDQQPQVINNEPPKAPEPQKQNTVVHVKPHRHYLLSFIIILLLAGAGILGHLWYDTNEQLKTERTKFETLQSERDALGTPDEQAQAQGETDSIPSFGMFNDEYNNILQSTIDYPVTEDFDEAEILAAVAEDIEATTLDAGAAVLAVYQVVKPDTDPTGTLEAIVYLPGNNEKPASFVNVIKPVDGEWAVFVDGM